MMRSAGGNRQGGENGGNRQGGRMEMENRGENRMENRGEYRMGGMENRMEMEGRYRGGNRARNEYEGGRMGYEPEDRFRDRRGREHYDNGRFAPARNEYEGGEMRRGRRGGARNEGEMRGEYNGRERAENRREEWGEDDEMRGDYWPRPYFPPYGNGEDGMNLIGFARGAEMGGDMEYHDEHHKGYAHGSMKFTPEMAEEWTRSMKNEDGTKGPHWTQEQAKKVMAQRGLVYDPAAFWAILNSLYSDFCGVFKKHGVNNMEFYADLTAAWLNDKDAVQDKAGAYYTCVVKH